MSLKNKYGIPINNELEIIEAVRKNPDINLNSIIGKNLEQYNKSIDETYSQINKINMIESCDSSIEDYHKNNINNWLMPTEYKNLDIAKYLLDQCNNDSELQRMGEELLLFQTYNLFGLLKYLKYLVDTLDKNNILLGVGRGSSVASFALFKLKVHRIDSLFYQIPISEFLHE